MSAVLGNLLGLTRYSVPVAAAVQDVPVKAKVLFVDSFRDFVVYRANSAATVNPTTVFAAKGGVGRWERLGSPNASWLLNPFWYISFAAGNDENDGLTSLTPIKTPSELVRRLGKHWAVLPQFVNIVVMDDLPDDDSLTLYLSPSIAASGAGSGLAVTGVLNPAPYATGTLLSYVALNRTTHAPNTITANSITWSDHVGRHVRLTSGARSGYSAVVAAAPGGNVAELGPWGPPPNPVEAQAFATPTFVTDVAGTETFEIIKPPSVGNRCHFSFRLGTRPGALTAAQTGSHVHFADLLFPGGSNTANAILACFIEFLEPGILGYVNRCNLGNLVFGAGLCRVVLSRHNGGVMTGLSGVGNTPRFLGCVFTRTGGVQTPLQHAGNALLIDGDSILQNTPLQVGSGSGQSSGFMGSVTLGHVMVRGCTGVPGVLIHPNGRVINQNGLFGGHLVYGNGNGHGIQAQSGGAFIYDSTKPTVTGTTADTLVGGTTKAYAAIPFVEPANNAMIVVRA